ncbi:MAG: C45 family autoproteolytic acyltransferase/hydrolase [Galactobacter sp.]
MNGAVGQVEMTRLEAVSGLEWTVLRGNREEVMRALGREHAEDIRAWRDLDGGAWARMVTRTSGVAAERFHAVMESSRMLLPVEANEIDLIAEGAGLPAEDLWAINLRGDLGHDGIGCSDVCSVPGDGVIMGHNEDGDGEVRGLVRLVTLAIDDDPTVTVVWYPGMLPANSFVTTSAGLSFGCDHVPVPRALLAGAGRHLVARHAQRQTSGDDARDVLTSVPCAGGFAFDVADGPGARGDLVENAAGHVAVSAAGGADAPLLHTNHITLVDTSLDALTVPAAQLEESLTRGGALEEHSALVDSPEAALAALRAPGVLNTSDELHTFASVVVDTAADKVMVQGDPNSGVEVWEGRLTAFARGERVPA